MSTKQNRSPRAVSSPELRAFLESKSIQERRHEELGNVVAALHQAHEALLVQNGRFHTNYGRDLLLPATEDALTTWIRNEWMPIETVIGSLKNLIGVDARVVLTLPLQPHIMEQTRRGVTVIQDILRPLGQSHPSSGTVRSTARDLEELFRADTSAPFYYDRMIDWAQHSVAQLLIAIGSQAKSLHVNQVGELARTLWMPPQCQEMPHRKGGRPLHPDGSLDDAAVRARERGSTYEAIAIDQNRPVEAVKAGVKRARARIARAAKGHKPLSSAQKQETTHSIAPAGCTKPGGPTTNPSRMSRNSRRS